MIIVKLKDGETIDKALRRYKKRFEKVGILKEMRARMYFLKPSEERREVLKRAVRRQEIRNEEME